VKRVKAGVVDRQSWGKAKESSAKSLIYKRSVPATIKTTAFSSGSLASAQD